MKKIINTIMLITFMFVSSNCYADDFVAKSSHTQFTDTTTTHTYTVDNKKYNVYVTKKGAYYIWKVSKKTNKLYKMYLPKDIQIKCGRKYN